ncbi:uncharacterized protein ABDE67_020303 [Symphorus nematophorus]
MAAAASLSRSRGVSGVKSTKGLFSILTLLCLVCLTSSLINKDKLEKLKETVQKAEQKLDFKKAEMATNSEIMNYYVKFMDPLTALVKKATKELPDDFPPVEELMETLKGFVEKTKTFVDGQNEELGEEMEKTEKKLREIKKLIEVLEEQQAEL